MIFGRWRPLGLFLATLLFGFGSALAQRLPEFSPSAATLFQALPYVLTLVAVAGLVGRSVPPAADGIPYKREGLILQAGLAGAALSGLPSTVVTLLRGEDLLDGARAAGAIVLPGEQRTRSSSPPPTPVHLALSLGWAAVLARTLPRGPRAALGRRGRPRHRRAGPRRDRAAHPGDPRAAAGRASGRTTSPTG